MRISVVIPALNEEATIAHVVGACLADAPYEVIVVDADSADTTAARARAAGARVVSWREVVPHIPPRPGKGESLWRGVAAARGDVVCFIDADLESAAPGMVSRLCEPFADPSIMLVKATYPRTFNGAATGGGRVTELTAKPLLDVFFPELTGIEQPLGGEYALRRSAAVLLPFVEGYGVDVGLLIDCAQAFGAASIAQVELDPRVHRNRPLAELSPMAVVVARTILDRAQKGSALVAQRPALGKVE